MASMSCRHWDKIIDCLTKARLALLHNTFNYLVCQRFRSLQFVMVEVDETLDSRRVSLVPRVQIPVLDTNVCDWLKWIR